MSRHILDGRHSHSEDPVSSEAIEKLVQEYAPRFRLLLGAPGVVRIDTNGKVYYETDKKKY